MTMRSMWTGTLGVALMVLPVKLGTVVSDNSLELHRYRKSDGSRIKMVRTAAADGREVGYADTAPGYELPDGTVVLLTDDDLEQAFGTRSKAAKVITFTDASQLPRTASGASYYVQPGPNGDRPYALLAETLKRTGKAAVVTIMIREHEAHALLYTDGGGYLILERLNWAADVKRPDFAAPSADLSAADLDIAENLVTQMSSAWDWEAAKDPGAERLDAVIRAKAGTGQAVGVPLPQGTTANAPTVDLTAALLASVEQARQAKAPAKPARARKPAARRTAAVA